MGVVGVASVVGVDVMGGSGFAGQPRVFTAVRGRRKPHELDVAGFRKQGLADGPVPVAWLPAARERRDFPGGQIKGANLQAEERAEAGTVRHPAPHPPSRQ